VGQRATGDAVAMKILEIWMSTPFDAGRHTARLENITALEERLKKEYS
jgi:ribose 5-phosphate isomerase RpiB